MVITSKIVVAYPLNAWFKGFIISACVADGRSVVDSWDVLLATAAAAAVAVAAENTKSQS